MKIPGYERESSSLNTVAIRVDNRQTEIYAPDHTSEVANGWPVANVTRTCGTVGCAAKYSLGYNENYGPTVGLDVCIKQLDNALDKDHEVGRPHRNEYVF